jgi:transposase InsO family protein
VKLDVYDSPGELERAMAHFVEYYNHRRLHESLQNVTSADVYTGRQAAILRGSKAVHWPGVGERI